MVQFIIGGIMAAGGIFLSIFLPLKYKNKNVDIRFEKTTSISELKEILTRNAEAGLEGYRHYVELKGIAGSDNPEKAPFSEKEAAYFNASLFQVNQEKQNPVKGVNAKQDINKSESLITTQKSSNMISLSDIQSGEKVYIDPAQSGIRLDTSKTLDKFEPLSVIRNHDYFKNYRYTNMDSGTLGFRMMENTISLGQKLYVIGEALLDGSKILINRPRDTKKPFIVSVKSEEDIVQGNKTSANVSMVFGILLILAGIAVMIFIH